MSDDPDAASDDRDASREPAKTPRADQTTPWAEHKRAGEESFQRGAFDMLLYYMADFYGNDVQITIMARRG